MAASTRMPPTLRALLVVCLAGPAVGCGDSAEDDGFIADGRRDGGQQDAAMPDAGLPTMDAGPDASSDAETTDTDAPEEPDTGPPPVDPCPIYCERALENCTGSNALYPDEASCLDACAPMPAGMEGDTQGNSAWCRAHHAGEAASDPTVSCGIASESGDHVCGTPCEAYCDQILAHCTGDQEQFVDRVACMAACSGYPDGSWYDTTGDTVQCRTFRARLSALENPQLNCAAAGESGGNTCS